jgi:spermidine synthase
MVCQWLPLYELTPENVRSVVRTFQEHFPYTMLWLTHKDAEIVGSNAPIVIDEAELAGRIAEPAIADDLKRVMMGSAADFLSYFVMGTEGMKKFSRGAIINTDDNLYLEFSAPYSIGNIAVMGKNVTAVIHKRESILPYLAPAGGAAARAEQVRRWAVNRAAADTVGQAQVLFLGGRYETVEFKKLMGTLDATYPQFAPGRFLKNEYLERAALNPTLLEKTAFVFLDERGAHVRVEISAVLVPISGERVSVVFVDNDAQAKYGEVYVSGDDKNIRMRGIAHDVMTSIRAAYQREVELASRHNKALPPAGPTLRILRDIISSKVREYQGM